MLQLYVYQTGTAEVFFLTYLNSIIEIPFLLSGCKMQDHLAGKQQDAHNLFVSWGSLP